MQSDIGSLLHKVSTALDKVSDQVLLDRLGIGLSQFRVLLYLLSDAGARQKIIAANLAQTEPSVSRQVKVLQEKGLAVVRRSTSSRRDRLVFLTKKGATTAEKAVNILNEYHAPMFARISREEQRQLIETLRTMQGYLK
ncbi:MAG TPA: MarR family winged helix-turn-helix transcriptional regulator [Candidatus Saccharimonadales bacterium]|nr:MarR family winged helix-turn-helix transcriptional regulator [Candidatus Saccharimonadales bacterium]